MWHVLTSVPSHGRQQADASSLSPPWGILCPLLFDLCTSIFYAFGFGPPYQLKQNLHNPVKTSAHPFVPHLHPDTYILMVSSLCCLPIVTKLVDTCPPPVYSHCAVQTAQDVLMITVSHLNSNNEAREDGVWQTRENMAQKYAM